MESWGGFAGRGGGGGGFVWGVGLLGLCPGFGTRGGKPLDHCYYTLRAAYKAGPRPPIVNAHRDSILLIPAYRHKL